MKKFFWNVVNKFIIALWILCPIIAISIAVMDTVEAKKESVTLITLSKVAILPDDSSVIKIQTRDGATYAQREGTVCENLLKFEPNNDFYAEIEISEDKEIISFMVKPILYRSQY